MHHLNSRNFLFGEHITEHLIDPRATTGKGWLTSSRLEGNLSGRELNALGWVVPASHVDGFSGVDGAMWVPWVGMLVGLRV